MAASLAQCRAVSGCRAFAPTRLNAQSMRSVVAFGAKRKDSFMVETNVGEEEPEDIAVRRFMTSVIESRLLDQLRWRRYKETNQERIKRRTKERHEIRKLRIVEPTWDELYGEDVEAHPFDSYFKGDTEGGDDIFSDANMGDGTGDVYNDLKFADQSLYNTNNFGSFVTGSQGGYMNGPSGGYMEGGYMNPPAGGYQEGGYMNPPAGGYQEGGYMNPPAGGYQEGGYMNTPSKK